VTLAPDTPLAGAVHPSCNHEPRRGGPADMLLLHYTGVATAAVAIDWLSRPESKVSCHYVVDEHGLVTQMVAESRRAWHAGVAVWAGETDINSRSIGIEIHNPGHGLGYTEFSPAQLRAVVALCRDILARNAIPADRVLGHSDVAPLRKADPGEKFPWAALAEAGIGLWVDPPEATGDAGYGPGAGGPAVAAAQETLAAIGYGIRRTGEMDPLTVAVLTAFQRRFRPARVDGRLDTGTRVAIAQVGARFQGPAA
jgi:N-acetylmuramoyl-L-alanine amidase